MKVALVYDRVNKWGGAERVLLTLHEIFPRAPLYTSVYNPATAPWAKVFPQIHTSFLQKLPGAKSNHEKLAVLMPLAFESFDFSEYDLVVSVTSEAAKGIITPPQTKHLCYCLTPTRYLWSHYQDYFTNPALRLLSQPAVGYLRRWDRVAAQRPDVMIAISHAVARRINQYYGRQAPVVYPPLTQLKKSSRQIGFKDYFLVVSRLVAYKKVDFVIRVFNELALPLVIIGQGSQKKFLQGLARDNIHFVEKVSDSQLTAYLAGAKALIFPQEEDFGLVAIEAMACGTPVIAYQQGGALETVTPGQSGIFFKVRTKAALLAAIKEFAKTRFEKNAMIKNTQRFSKTRFKKELLKIINGKGQI